MRSDRLNINSSDYNKQYSNDVLLEYNYITCGSPIVSHAQTGAAAVTAAKARVGLLVPGTENQLQYTEMCRIGAFTAAGDTPQVEGTVPATDTASTAAGLNLQGDHDTATDLGWEWTLGGPFGSAGNKFTAGTDSGYIDATFFCADWTDYDVVSIGFRIVEDYNVAHAPIIAAGTGDPLYTDFATFGCQEADKLQIASDINDGGSGDYDDTGQTPTDSQNLRLRMDLAGSGAVSYRHISNAVAGAGTLAPPSATQAYTFTSGDVVIPYIMAHGGAGHVNQPLFLKDIKIVKFSNGSWNPNV